MSGELRPSNDPDVVLVHPRRHTVHERCAAGVACCGNGRTIKIAYCEISRSEIDADWPLCDSAGCRNARRDSLILPRR